MTAADGSLTGAHPVKIQTDAENELALSIVEAIMKKGEGRATPAEEALLNLLFPLIEAFEAEAYPIPRATPAGMIIFFLEDRGLKAAALLPIFGSRCHISDVLSGRREVTAAKAKALGEFFAVSPELFI